MQSKGHADRFNLFASTSANGCRGAREKERHIAAELRGQLPKLSLRQLQLPKSIESDQRCGGVARAPAQACRYGNPLMNINADSSLHTGVGPQQRRSLPHQIARTSRNVIARIGDTSTGKPRVSRGCIHAPQSDFIGGIIRKNERVVDVDQHHESFEFMVAIGPFAQYFQKQVNLRRCMDSQKVPVSPKQHWCHIL